MESVEIWECDDCGAKTIFLKHEDALQCPVCGSEKLVYKQKAFIGIDLASGHDFVGHY